MSGRSNVIFRRSQAIWAQAYDRATSSSVLSVLALCRDWARRLDASSTRLGGSEEAEFSDGSRESNVGSSDRDMVGDEVGSRVAAQSSWVWEFGKLWAFAELDAAVS